MVQRTVMLSSFTSELEKIAAVKPGLVARARELWKKGLVLPKDKRPKFEVSKGVLGSPVFK